MNPRSFRASRWGLAARATRRAREAGLEVSEVADPAQLAATLDALRARGQQQVWMLAGDGTIHALAEYFAARPAADWSPAFLFLAGGRANIVPRDCGGYPAMPALQRALAALAAGRPLAEESLPGLAVIQSGAPARHGFLLAGGFVYEGVRLCSAHREAGSTWLHRSWFADPYVLARLAVQTWTGRSPLPPPARIAVRMDGGPAFESAVRVLLATSLQLRDALYNPFAARGQGPLRLTAVAAAADRFWRRLPALLGGRFEETMDPEHGYLSGRCGSIELRGLAGYALDGELFACDASLPLAIRPGIALRVLRA